MRNAPITTTTQVPAITRVMSSHSGMDNLPSGSAVRRQPRRPRRAAERERGRRAAAARIAGAVSSRVKVTKEVPVSGCSRAGF
ncbi:hypothetical protein Shyhy02_47170 [Streptomyces hygroscopicus subsp. hygroscopicus]|nr:hypothetical protein Shyhy02_47170 [Streptomyces hygroscopicus subsp. hygroscopicus]